MTLSELYEIIGGDLDDVIERLEDAEIAEYAVMEFLSDRSYSMLMTEIREGRITSAFQTAHTLKGVCLCLGFTKLSEYAIKVCDILRSERLPDSEMTDCLTEEYNRTIQAIRQYREQL